MMVCFRVDGIGMVGGVPVFRDQPAFFDTHDAAVKDAEAKVAVLHEALQDENGPASEGLRAATAGGAERTQTAGELGNVQAGQVLDEWTFYGMKSGRDVVFRVTATDECDETSQVQVVLESLMSRSLGLKGLAQDEIGDALTAIEESCESDGPDDEDTQ